MLRIRFFALLAAFFCLTAAAVPSMAAEVEGGSVYCFTQEDFAREEGLSGICITGLPEETLGTVTLGDRVLRPGDILTADQLARMTFAPLVTEEDLSACVTYLPIHDGHAAPAVTMTIAIRGREDQPPVAEDSAHETYKNLPLEGKLKVREPEEQTMTFTGHTVTITGLTVGKTYTFTLKPGAELYLVGDSSLEFTASAIVLAEHLTITDYSGGTITVTWNTPEGAQVDSWTVRCYNDDGYSELLVTADTTASFSNIDPTKAHNIEVTASGMTQASRATMSADPTNITSVNFEESGEDKLVITWEFEGTAPEGSWLLMYSYDESDYQCCQHRSVLGAGAGLGENESPCRDQPPCSRHRLPCCDPVRQRHLCFQQHP